MLQVSWDIEESTKEMQTVKFILQPLLENSIEHGFERLDSGNNTINIKAYTKKQAVYRAERQRGWNVTG